MRYYSTHLLQTQRRMFLLGMRPPGKAVSPVGSYSSYYGAGTLMTVFTMVTDAFKPKRSAIQHRNVGLVALPGLDNVTPALAMMVPTMVPPPATLIVAALPTCQKTFLAWAPLIRFTLATPGPVGSPTVSELPIWKTQTALALPWASSVRIPSRYPKLVAQV